MDEAVPRGRAEVPQRAGENRQETGQAEERLCLGWRGPLTSSAQPPSSGVFWFQHPIVGGTWGVCVLFFLWVSVLCSPYFNPSELDFPFWQSHSEFARCSHRSMNVRFSSSWSSLPGWDYKLCLLMKQPSWSRTGVVGCFFSQQPSSQQLVLWRFSATRAVLNEGHIFFPCAASFVSVGRRDGVWSYQVQFRNSPACTSVPRRVVPPSLYFSFWAMGHMCLMCHVLQGIPEGKWIHCVFMSTRFLGSVTVTSSSFLPVSGGGWLRQTSKLPLFFFLHSVLLLQCI